MATTPKTRALRLQRVTAVCAQRLSRLGLIGYPALRVEPKTEGFRNHHFGLRSGPTYTVDSLFHELAHAAEFGADSIASRVSEAGSFVFKLPTKWVYNQFVEEPVTSQATMRELKTFAFQLHLMRLAGIKRSQAAFFKESAELLRLMHDWWHVQGGSEEARALTCQQVLQEEYQKIDASQVLSRLKAWLNAKAANN